jgi:quercetin dioxygenase-like cupin family protein
MLDCGAPVPAESNLGEGCMPTRSPIRAAAMAADGEVLDGLLMRTALRDQGAFRALYDSTAGRLRIVRERSLAEDVLQEAYVRIWERARQFDPARGSAVAWIIAIARHHAIDVVRSRPRELLATQAPLAGDREIAPPADMFDRVRAAIASRSQLLPGTLTVRAAEGVWETLSPGVEREMLWSAGPNERVTFLVRMAPGARFDAHAHDDDEECYVVAGDLTFDTLTLKSGDYHLARRGIPHPACASAGGCLLLITAAAA